MVFFVAKLYEYLRLIKPSFQVTLTCKGDVQHAITYICM